jgi:hypothetical protein
MGVKKMTDLSQDLFVQAVRSGESAWLSEGKEPTYYEDMSDKHLRNCIKEMERVKKTHDYEDIRPELDAKIKEMDNYLKAKNRGYF